MPLQAKIDAPAALHQVIATGIERGKFSDLMTIERIFRIVSGNRFLKRKPAVSHGADSRPPVKP